jgi:hypothetical membrane protein
VPLRTMVVRANTHVFSFANKHPAVGPVVFISSVLYFFIQIAVAWVWSPPYSVVKNAISDLGNSACGSYRGAYVCSSRHWLMNFGFIGLGLIMAAGSWLIFQEFTEHSPRQKLASKVGFSLMAAAGIGTILVGIFPENGIHFLHMFGAGIAIGVGNVAIVVLGLALPLPEGLRKSMIVMGVVSLSALVLFAAQRDLGIGAGSMERIAAYPETFWLIRFGLYMTKSHRTRQLPAT